MSSQCSSCGNLNPPTAKFCGDCGAKLGSSAALAVPPVASRDTEPKHPASSAERRQLTVMFCDLVDSTALSLRLDPEDLRDVIAAYHNCVGEVMRRFGGFVAKYMGDGVLVYFGYPQAHEEDGERAVRAGLALIEAIGRLATSPEQRQVRVRHCDRRGCCWRSHRLW
jgi:class 3 adenylate cyclase